MPTLTGERLTLRDFEPYDEAALHAFASDPAVTRYTAWGPNTEADTREFLSGVLAQARTDARDCYSVAVVETTTGRLVGSVELSVESTEHARGELGFVFDPSCWGRGYATEATRVLMAFGFDELGLHRIAATCHPDNVASSRVLEKARLTFEGRMRGHLRVRDGWRDSMLYSVISPD